MSNSDRILNANIEKQSIYDIFRACRLCGAGGGYKMPIIQSVLDLDGSDVELKQKIRECVQIEVNIDDKMPPLICELCVDKVNDFYEFLEMCRQTNKQTRLRLGLPPQTMPRGAPDADDCILGVTEPLFVHDSDNEPLTRPIKKEPKLRREEKSRKKETNKIDSPSSSRASTPPRLRGGRVRRDTLDSDHSKKEQERKIPKAGPKSILKKDSIINIDSDDDLLVPRPKRTREKVEVKEETPLKKVKITIKLPVSQETKPSPKSVPSSKKTSLPAIESPKPTLKAPPGSKCEICDKVFKNVGALGSHKRHTHTPAYTATELACNACGLWFENADEVAAHHKRHGKSKPYRCRHCAGRFKLQEAYDKHFVENPCKLYEVLDMECGRCTRTYPTKKLLDEHKCTGEKTGKSKSSSNTFKAQKTDRQKETTAKKKSKGVVIDPSVKARLRTATVRLRRCDDVVSRRGHCDVSALPANYGFDKNIIYPYRDAVRVKTEPFDVNSMVQIKAVPDEFYVEEDFVHWDSSDNSSDSDDEIDQNKVASLTALSLKTIFSKRCLGKVPRKRRKLKMEKFDSFLNTTDFDGDIKRDIDSIIDHLGVDDNSGDRNYDSDSIIDRRKVDDNTDSIINGDRVADQNIDSKDTERLSTNENIVSQDTERLNIDQNIDGQGTERLNIEGQDAERSTDENIDSQDTERLSAEQNIDSQEDGLTDASNFSVDSKHDTDSNNDKVTGNTELLNSNPLAVENLISKNDKMLNGSVKNDSYIDDRKLMEEFAVHIDGNTDSNVNSGDKILLEDLVQNNAMEVDKIPEEFNFDA